LQVGY